MIINHFPPVLGIWDFCVILSALRYIRADCLSISFCFVHVFKSYTNTILETKTLYICTWAYLNKYKRTLTHIHKAIEIGSSVDGSLLYDEWVVRICDCHQLKYIYRYDYPGLNVHDDERLLWFNCLRRDSMLLSNVAIRYIQLKL